MPLLCDPVLFTICFDLKFSTMLTETCLYTIFMQYFIPLCLSFGYINAINSRVSALPKVMPVWVFSRCSGFLPQGKLTGWVRINTVKVIPQFCIAHFYCTHLITYNFIHYTYVPFKKKHFMTILCYYKTSLVTFVQRITLKSMFSKKAYKSVARVPCVCSIFIYLYFTF